MTDDTSPKFKVGDHVMTTREASLEHFRRAIREGYREFGIVVNVEREADEDGGGWFYDVEPDFPSTSFTESELEVYQTDPPRTEHERELWQLLQRMDASE